MATISYTFDTLKIELRNWAEGSEAGTFPDFEESLDEIIGLAERACYRDLELEIFDQTDTSKATAVGVGTLELADDAILLRSLWVNAEPAEQRAESYVRYYQKITGQALPLYWAQSGETEILLAPIPGAIYATEQRVLKPPTGLSASAQTSFLSEHAGDLLFQACMLQAQAFDKESQEFDRSNARYQDLLVRARHELRRTMRVDY